MSGNLVHRFLFACNSLDFQIFHIEITCQPWLSKVQNQRDNIMAPIETQEGTVKNFKIFFTDINSVTI